MRLKKTYSSREVASVTGLSARQLQIWDAGGLMRAAVPPRRTAAGGFTERRYTPIEVLELMVMAELRRRGFTVNDLRLMVRALKRHFNASVFEASGGGGHVQLLTDGVRIFARNVAGEYYDLLEAPAEPLLVEGDVRKLKPVEGKLKLTRSGRPSRDRQRDAG